MWLFSNSKKWTDSRSFGLSNSPFLIKRFKKILLFPINVSASDKGFLFLLEREKRQLLDKPSKLLTMNIKFLNEGKYRIK